MSTPSQITAESILAELGNALKTFGNYAFDDKGPHEVMDLDVISSKLHALSPAEAAQILREVHASPLYEGRPETLVGSLLSVLDDWDALFDEPDMEDYYI